MKGRTNFIGKIGYVVLVTSVVLALLIFNHDNLFASDSNDLKTVVKGNNEFAFDLYKQLKNKEGGNIFFSPASISTALAMTYAGARGETEKQMAKTLHFTLSQKQLHSAFLELINGLKSKKEYELNIANALWGQAGYKFLKEFIYTTKKQYGAGFKEVDFMGDTEGSRVKINRWVEKETKNKIKDLIKPNILTPDVRLVLTNAIYFKGSWVYKFETKNTHKMPFYLIDSKSVQAPMMMQRDNFKYAENDTFQILEMPYAGDKLSMVILLPRGKNGLNKVENMLTAGNLEKWLNELKKEKVDVFIPKFKMTRNFELGGTLSLLGMKDAFLRKADFSGMTVVEGLYISHVLHKAFVDVNEEGTEAAAATAVVMAMKSIPRNPIMFKADHPFIFLIRDISSGTILFAGRVMNPTD